MASAQKIESERAHQQMQRLRRRAERRSTGDKPIVAFFFCDAWAKGSAAGRAQHEVTTLYRERLHQRNGSQVGFGLRRDLFKERLMPDFV